MIKAITEFITRWGSKTTYTIADQAIFSGTNFIVNILLARWLLPADYGGFVITFSAFLILAGIQNSLVLEPMSVFGPKLYKKNLRSYFVNILRLQIGLTICIVIIGTIIASMQTDVYLKKTIWALPIFSPLILQLWFIRRVHYVQINPKSALALSIKYCISILAGLFLLRSFDLESGFLTLLLMGAASFAICCKILYQIGSDEFRSPGTLNSSRSLILMRHWKYGKWALGDWIAFTLSVGIIPILIGYFGGLQQAGEFRAMQNLVLPLTQTIIALNMLLLPWASKRLGSAGNHLFSKTALSVFLIFLAVALIYALALIASGPWLVSNLYSQSEYINSIWLLYYLGAESVLNAVSCAFAITLRAAVCPNRVFWSKMISAAFTITFGIILGKMFGMYGLVIALVSGTFLRAVFLVFQSFLLSQQFQIEKKVNIIRADVL